MKNENNKKNEKSEKITQGIPKWRREAAPKKYPNGAAKRRPRNTRMAPRSGAQEVPEWRREAAPKKYLNGAAKRRPRNTQMGP